MKALFSEYKLNDQLTLKNRIVMAPMTRVKAVAGNVPTPAATQYYARRADAGLIVTEGTIISPEATGYHGVPGIYSQAQIDQWQQVSNAVHANGGNIFMQIWHVGRVSHPEFIDGKLPVAPSKTFMSERVKRTKDLYYGESRALTLDEVHAEIATYAQAAKNAIAAGFDGVEIHGANGYLIDQFMHYDTNKRDDEFGGTPQNMARFALMVVQAVAEAVGCARTAIRLSPAAYLNEIKPDARDMAVFEYLLRELSKLPIAYVHTGNFDDTKTHAVLNNMTMTHFMRNNYAGTLIAAGSYSAQTAEQGIEKGDFDLAAFGRPFIANPDLVKKLANGEALQDYDAGMLDELY